MGLNSCVEKKCFPALNPTDSSAHSINWLLLGLNKLILVNHLEKCLAYSKL